jgi:hypothetical protein
MRCVKGTTRRISLAASSPHCALPVATNGNSVPGSNADWAVPKVLLDPRPKAVAIDGPNEHHREYWTLSRHEEVRDQQRHRRGAGRLSVE